MSEKGRVNPPSTLWPGVENICLGSGCFGAQKFGMYEGGCLEVSLKTTIFTVFFAKIGFNVFGTCCDKIESYPTIHVRVTPLSTFFSSYVARAVDSGVTHRWIVG